MSSGHRRSFSQLSSFTNCGMAYYLERIVTPRPPKKPAAWFLLGNALHEAYDIWERAGRTGPTMVEMFGEIYDRIYEEEKVVQPDMNLWQYRPNVKNAAQDVRLTRDNGLKQAQAFHEHCSTSEWKIWHLPDDEPAIETSFQVEFGGGLVVIGKIDQILEWPDGRISIRDLKTGNKKEDNRQLGLYRVAVAEIFGVDITDGEFWYTKTGNSGGWVDLRRYTKEFVGEQYRRMDAAVDAGLFLVRPGEHCNLCGVYDACPERGPLSAETQRSASTENDIPPF